MSKFMKVLGSAVVGVGLTLGITTPQAQTRP